MSQTDVRTHIDIFYGQMTQMNTGSAFPTTQQDPMYLVGNDDGLNDGDIYFAATNGNDVLGIHIGGGWSLIAFSPV